MRCRRFVNKPPRIKCDKQEFASTKRTRFFHPGAGLYGARFAIEDQSYYEPVRNCCDQAFYTDAAYALHVSGHIPVSRTTWLTNYLLDSLHLLTVLCSRMLLCRTSQCFTTTQGIGEYFNWCGLTQFCSRFTVPSTLTKYFVVLRTAPSRSGEKLANGENLCEKIHLTVSFCKRRQCYPESVVSYHNHSR